MIDRDAAFEYLADMVQQGLNVFGLAEYLVGRFNIKTIGEARSVLSDFIKSIIGT